MFVLFVAILCPILAYFKKKIEALIELRKMRVLKEKNYKLYGLGIAQPLRYPDYADLQECN